MNYNYSILTIYQRNIIKNKEIKIIIKKKHNKIITLTCFQHENFSVILVPGWKKSSLKSLLSNPLCL